MASELQNSMRNAAAKIAAYVDDVATMTVETRFVQVGAGGDVSFDQAKPIARTTIKLDRDCDAIIPMSEAAGASSVDAALFDLHQRNVATAIEYRARILNALVGALQGRPMS